MFFFFCIVNSVLHVYLKGRIRFALSGKWNAFQESMLFNDEIHWKEIKLNNKNFFEKNEKFNNTFRSLLHDRILTISNFLWLTIGIYLISFSLNLNLCSYSFRYW